MMLPENRRKAGVWLGSFVALVFTWVLLLELRGPSIYYAPSEQQPLGTDDDAAWVQAAMAVEFPAPIDYAPLRTVCARPDAPFREGLVFTCEDQHGGVGMLRNQILKCLRFAIAAGAGAVVVPSMALRNPHDISDIETATAVPLEHLFDRPAFVRHLTAACPGMRLYKRLDDVPGYPGARQGPPLDLLGTQFEPDHPRTGLTRTREWRADFDAWLARQGVRAPTGAGAPVHVRLGQSFLEWPVHEDGEAFAREFGKVLSFRADARGLAAAALLALHRRFSLPVDPARAISPGAYYGAHLRLEKDALDAWTSAGFRYSRMEDQFAAQYEHLVRVGLEVVYVASGNRTVVDLFAAYLVRRLAEDAALTGLEKAGVRLRNVTVVTKYDLLQGSDRKLLDSFTFDQQGLVDFLMMFKASAFTGVAYSSFPWNVALRRHELSKYAGIKNEGSDMLKDEYSTIMGSQADYPDLDPFEFGIWP